MQVFSTRTRRRTAALAGGAALALSGLATVPLMASTAAGAAPVVTGTSVYSGSTNVTTSTGHHLMVHVYASQSGGEGTSISVSLSTPDSAEYHSWGFQAPDSALDLTAQGAGTITLKASQMGGFGLMKLHVRPVAKAKSTMCQGQLVSKSRKVNIAGIFKFVTKSSGAHKWGTVGSSTHSFAFDAPSSVSWSYENTATCPSQPSGCYAGSSWGMSQSTGKTNVYLSGGTSGRKSYAYGSRSTQLTKPAGAYRYDSGNVSTRAAKFSVDPDGTAHMRPSIGRGTADLASDQSYDYTRPCGTGSKSVSTKSWSQSSYTNGPTPLKVPMQIFGPISVKDSDTNGYFSRTKIVS